MRKASKGSAAAATAPAPAPIYEEDAHWEDDDDVGHMPNLGQVPETQKGTPGKRADSVASSTRRRHSEDSNSSRLRLGPKRSSSRRAESLTKQSNPSLVSVGSGLTTASESTMTLTGKSERRRKEKSTKGSKVKRSKRAATPSIADTDATQSDVFQYLNQDNNRQPAQSDAGSVLQASSASVASSIDSRLHDMSSDASEGAHTTPRTSPTSTRRSHSHDVPYYGQYQNASGKPLYASSFVHGPGEEEAEYSGPYSDEESDYDDDHTQHPSQSAPYWQYPPNAHPQAPHTNVLRSPQPHHNVPYAGVLSPHAQPAVPAYNPSLYSATSPTTLASQASGWPSFPPPLAIGNSPHRSPVAMHALPNMIQSPVGAHAVPAHHMAMIPQRPAQAPANDTMIGYELLAHKLSELKKGSKADAVVPAYRKFEQLNHRVLLHLQDEISELEEELRQLDKEIAEASPGAQTGQRHPASRRGDTHFGNDLHQRRIEKLGQVFLKLEQYSKWLAMPMCMKRVSSSSNSH